MNQLTSVQAWQNVVVIPYGRSPGIMNFFPRIDVRDSYELIRYSANLGQPSIIAICAPKHDKEVSSD